MAILDDKDEALLRVLEQNARASVVELAHRIGLSRSATQQRLARLESNGAVGGYTIRRGSSAPNRRLHAWLLVRHNETGNCARVLPDVRKDPDVTAVFALAGDIDLLVEAEPVDAGALERLADRIRALPGIARVTSHVVLAAHR